MPRLITKTSLVGLGYSELNKVGSGLFTVEVSIEHVEL